MWASLWNCIRGANRPDLEKILEQQKRSGFEGPETLPGLARKLASIGIPWAATEDGDVELLEAATASNRWAVIGYYTGHAVNFCGFATINRDSLRALYGYADRNQLEIRSSSIYAANDQVGFCSTTTTLNPTSSSNLASGSSTTGNATTTGLLSFPGSLVLFLERTLEPGESDQWSR